jgi:hypothetical protein
MNTFTGAEGLERAAGEIREYHDKEGKNPSSSDFKDIKNAISRGYWVEFGISTWNDFLLHVLGEVYRTRNDYNSDDSVERMKQELRDFKEQFHRLPTTRDKKFRPVAEAIRRGSLKRCGITCWNDLLEQLFGTINRERGKYIGDAGLRRAMQELKEIEREQGKLPTSRGSRLANRIWEAVTRGNWVELGITTWNDLLFRTFGKVNRN